MILDESAKVERRRGNSFPTIGKDESSERGNPMNVGD
jgi:hypothetical protein